MRSIYVFNLLVLFSLLTAGCSEYQAVLKSNDPEYKLSMAKKYFEDEKYEKCRPLFDDLLTIYKGQQKAADIYFYFAETNFYLKDYILSAYHYKNFAKTFPNHEKTAMAYYMVGYSYYLQSPSSSLDQTYTFKAINELQLFTNLYPSSEMLLSANELIENLRLKLEQKSFDRAKLYFHTENYQAAVVAFNNMVDAFPDTDYKEDALYYGGLSAFKLAENSIESKRLQRYIECRTVYREFLDLYPESEYAKEVQKNQNKTESKIKELKEQS